MLATAVHARVPTATLARCRSPTRPSTAPSRRRWPTCGGSGGRRGARAGRDGGPPRERFLPASEVRRRAAYDGPLDIGHGQTNSQPRTVRAMLELLDVQPGPAGARRRVRVGLDDRAARRAGRADRLGARGRAGARPRASPVRRNVEAVRDAVGPGPRRGRRACSGHPTRRPSTGSWCRPWRPGSRRSWSPSWARTASSWCRWPAGCCASQRDAGAPGGRRVTEHGHYRFVPLVTDPGGPPERRPLGRLSGAVATSSPVPRRTVVITSESCAVTHAAGPAESARLRGLRRLTPSTAPTERAAARPQARYQVPVTGQAGRLCQRARQAGCMPEFPSAVQRPPWHARTVS